MKGEKEPPRWRAVRKIYLLESLIKDLCDWNTEREGEGAADVIVTQQMNI